MVIDGAVVGAGPAGLAASAALGARGVEHVVLERGRAGESWRTQRWESFRLNTPGWMNRLLGEQAPDTYATGVEVIQRLDKLAGDCPVRGGVPVAQLAPAGDGHALRTDGDEILARAVVVATGDQNLPKVPALARTFPVDGERVNFDDSVAANVAAGDAFAAQTTAMVDEIIRRRGPDAPPAEPDDHDAPVDQNPPAWLDLHAEEVGGVVWCTGFSGDFSWLDPALVDLDGQPRHADGAGPAPGLWYLGLRWLVRRRSSLLFGFPDDAGTVADAVRAHLTGRQR